MGKGLGWRPCSSYDCGGYRRKCCGSYVKEGYRRTIRMRLWTEVCPGSTSVARTFFLTPGRDLDGHTSLGSSSGIAIRTYSFKSARCTTSKRYFRAGRRDRTSSTRWVGERSSRGPTRSVRGTNGCRRKGRRGGRKGSRCRGGSAGWSRNSPSSFYRCGSGSCRCSRLSGSDTCSCTTSRRLGGSLSRSLAPEATWRWRGSGSVTHAYVGTGGDG